MEKIILMKNASRRGFIKKAARKMLFADWVRQILVFVITGAVFIGINYFGFAAAMLFDSLVGNQVLTYFVTYLFVFLSLVLSIPLMYGLLSFEIDEVCGDKKGTGELFCAFSQNTLLLRSYVLFFHVALRSLLCFLPALLGVAAYVFIQVQAEEMLPVISFGGIDLVSFLLRTVFILLLYLGILLASVNFIGAYITVKRPDLAVEECFFAARNAIKNNRTEFTMIALGFFPLFVVSLFTVGFLFVLYTTPYMFITYVMYSKYFYDKHNLVMNSESLAAERQISE